jgi:hypothetical protein
MYAMPRTVAPIIATPATTPPMMGPSFEDFAAAVDVAGGETVVAPLGAEDGVVAGVVNGLLLEPPV